MQVGRACSFDHEIEVEVFENSLEAKIVQLRDLIEAKDVQILELMKKISELEKQENSHHFQDDEYEESETATTSE